MVLYNTHGRNKRQKGITMNTIYEYRLKMGITELRLPKHAKVLSVGEQGYFSIGLNHLVMWVKVNVEHKPKTRYFQVVGRGQSMPESKETSFVGTVQSVTGFVWHVFEVMQ